MSSKLLLNYSKFCWDYKLTTKQTKQLENFFCSANKTLLLLNLMNFLFPCFSNIFRYSSRGYNWPHFCNFLYTKCCVSIHFFGSNGCHFECHVFIRGGTFSNKNPVIYVKIYCANLNYYLINIRV